MVVSRKRLRAACLVWGLAALAQPAFAEGPSVLLGERRPLGPRITAFKAMIGRVGAGVGLRLSARVMPDEAFPSVRPGRQDVQLTINERRLKREAYRFDPATGELDLVLDLDDFQTLCAPLPEPYRSFPQNRTFQGCRVELTVTSRIGGSATKKLEFSDPAAALSQLFGADGPAAVRLAPLIPGRLGSPGASPSKTALKAIEGPRPLPGIRHAKLRLTNAAGAEAAAVLTADGPPMWVGLGRAGAVSRATQPKPVPPGPTLAGAHHNGHDYVLHRIRSSEHGAFCVQDLTSGRRMDLPREVFAVDDFWASDEQVVVLGMSRLEAYGWDGRIRWRRHLLEADERQFRPALQEAALLGDGAGGIYLVGTGDLAQNGLSVPFLYGATYGSDGTTRASALLLDPAFGEYDAIESVAPALLAGRHLAVVSLSGPMGTRVRTRIFDLAEPTGRPVAELTPPMSTAPWWVWGAATMGAHLLVGTGNSGIAVYGVEEAR